MQKVTFHSENGFAPSYIYKDTLFYIADKSNGRGGYTYMLCSIPINPVAIEEFASGEEVHRFLDSKKARLVYRSDNKYLFSGPGYEYILEGNKVTIKQKPKQLSDEYDKYLDCLNYAKKYVANYIESLEHRQYGLFKDGGES